MDNIYDVIIIGAGPAGLSAALYAKRGNLKTLIIEKSTPGGTLVSISHLYNYPGYNGIDGASLAFTMYEQVTNLNVDFVFEEVVEVKLENNLKIVKTNVNEYVCKNIIVATGTTYQNLKVANERKFIGKGISYCAVCDGKLFTGKDIVTIGSSEHALKETIYLSQFANKIYMIIDQDISSSSYYQDLMNTNKVELISNAKITKLLGEELLEGVEIKINEERKTLNVSGVFPLIGSLPSNSFLSSFPIFASSGYMKVDLNCESEIKGIYPCGEGAGYAGGITSAAMDGIRVAEAIVQKYKLN